MNIKRLFLYVLIASVALSAVIGIGVMLFGNFGDFESRVLMTTTAITVTSILGLACGAYLETGRGKYIPITGIVFSVVSAVMWIIMIWAGETEGKLFAKVMMSATLIATSCSHLSLLSLARLDRRFIWATYAVHGAIWIVLSMLLIIIWAEYDPSDNWIARTLGALAIVIGALTIITPVFHKLSNQTDIGQIDAEIERLKARIAELEAQKARSNSQLEAESSQLE
ncbi:MAG: hypothetical protein IPN69_24660 [Acidobacteria bacterium]|nr:hypothetical protein [Acidobacteriota bacterium]MBK8147561.1 hypothetical protein [Acidobacteriota bacterium]MBK8813903.1 hypothetical protein [Acidobacteriota bacterium]